MAVSCKSHVLSQKLTLADRAFDLPRFLPPGVFQIVEAVPDVLHDDLLFIVHDETCSILAVKLTFKQEQVRGERFRFAVHVRGNLKIALVNDIPRSLVTGDLDAGAIWPLFFTGIYYLLFSGVLQLLLDALEKRLDYFKA